MIEPRLDLEILSESTPTALLAPTLADTANLTRAVEAIAWNLGEYDAQMLIDLEEELRVLANPTAPIDARRGAVETVGAFIGSHLKLTLGDDEPDAQDLRELIVAEFLLGAISDHIGRDPVPEPEPAIA